MALSFKDFKKNINSYEFGKQAETKNSRRVEDPNILKLDTNKENPSISGYFLPNINRETGEILPWNIQIDYHMVFVNGRPMFDHAVHPCYKHIGEKCPFCETYFQLYKKYEGTASCDVVKKFKRAARYYSNWITERCSYDPSEEGRVKILQYGSEINSLLTGAQNGDQEREISPLQFDNPLTTKKFLYRCSRGDSNKITYIDPTKGSSFIGEIGPLKFQGKQLPDSEMEQIFNSLFNLNDYFKDLKIEDSKTIEEEISSALEELGISSPFRKTSQRESQITREQLINSMKSTKKDEAETSHDEEFDLSGL